jgi:hypothetical protein
MEKDTLLRKGIMPSVKRSESSARKYGGRHENLELTYAIEFLFQIKGSEYLKNLPGFVIPSAQEFFEFSKNLNKTKKTKRAEAFVKFLVFIVPEMESNRELLCVSVVVLAIVLYIFTTNVIETTIQSMYSLNYDQTCKKVAESLKTEDGINRFVHPLSFFFTHYLTKQKHKEYLYNLAVDSIRKTVQVIPRVCTDTELIREQNIQCMRIGSKLLESIEMIFNSYWEVALEPRDEYVGEGSMITVS